MRRPSALAVVALLLGIAGCGGQGGESPPEARRSGSPEPAARPFRVALLSPGPISDAGWNAAAYEGLQEIERELGAAIAQVQTSTPPEFEAGFRDFASRGFDLVFGHGFEFQDAAAQVGQEFPKTIFITTSGSTVRENVAPMVFRLEEATYLLGLLAGSMSEGGKAAVVGGMEIPSVASTFLAFEAGVHAARPDMPVLRAWVGNWEDVSAAKEATLAQIRQGADFIFHNADAAGIGMFRAVEEARAQGKRVYAFGSNKDQTEVAPDVVLANAVLDIPRAFLTVAQQVKDGTFKARITELGMKDGIVSLTWNPRLEGDVPAEVLERVDAARASILDGALKVPTGF